jgi:hypothetical protein
MSYIEVRVHLDGYINKKMFKFEPQKMQGLPLPTHCIQRELKYGVHYRA